MKLAPDIEKLIRDARVLDVNTSSQMDQKILRAALQTQQNIKKNQSAEPQPHIWRIIMKSKPAKLTAAAVIIAAILLIYNFDGSIDGATIAWAQVEEAIDKVNWMHLIYNEQKMEDEDPWVVRGESNQVTWMAFDSKVVISESSHGKIIYRRYIEGKKYLYDPQENIIRISTIPPHDNFAMGSNSPIDLFGKLVQMEQEKEGRTVKEKDGKYNNKIVKIWEISKSDDQGKILAKLFLDKKTFLPIAVEMNNTRNGKTIMDFKVMFEYPEAGPKDIYEAGAPRSVEIIDNSN